MRQNRFPFKRVEHLISINNNKDPDLDEYYKKVKKTCWYLPLDHLTSKHYIRVQIGHFFAVMLSSWLAIFGSLMIGSMFGNIAGIVPPVIGVYAVLVGLAHVPVLYIAFNIRTWKYYDVRINPYISILEFTLHQRIGFWACCVELAAQSVGTVVAASFFYGVVHNSPLFVSGIGDAITNTSLGWAFFLELMAGLFMAWVYFHNWYHDATVRMPITMCYVIAGMSTIVYPFIGPTTHNPFRYLSACVIEGTCFNRGWWVYIFGPATGMIIGYLFHMITWRVKDYTD
jgi:hypothetical protein